LPHSVLLNRLSLTVFIEHDSMKTYRGVQVQLHHSFLNGGEWSASRSYRIIPSTHWIGGRVRPRAGLEAERKRKVSFPAFKVALISG
jgi:hypothetical protein